MKESTSIKKLTQSERFGSTNVAISELSDQKLPLIKTGTSVQEKITESLVDEFTPEE